MKYFVKEDSIVREIWGKSDTILFIFAGAAAEFALNKAVDWLYFTGRLPADPLGRLFSTVGYAKRIIFSERDAAHRAIDAMAAIHATVEAKRGQKIPDWAYRDVLFMLIDYSILAYELLERPLLPAEKEEVFDVFYRTGLRMGLTDLPAAYPAWVPVRAQHLRDDTAKGPYTLDLYRQYRKHLGAVRYGFLRQAQRLVVPPHVRQLLGLGTVPFLTPVLALYKVARALGGEWLVKSLILPPTYQAEIRALERQTA